PWLSVVVRLATVPSGSRNTTVAPTAGTPEPLGSSTVTRTVPRSAASIGGASESVEPASVFALASGCTLASAVGPPAPPPPPPPPPALPPPAPPAPAPPPPPVLETVSDRASSWPPPPPPPPSIFFELLLADPQEAAAKTRNAVHQSRARTVAA